MLCQETSHQQVMPVLTRKMDDQAQDFMQIMLQCTIDIEIIETDVITDHIRGRISNGMWCSKSGSFSFTSSLQVDRVAAMAMSAFVSFGEENFAWSCD